MDFFGVFDDSVSYKAFGVINKFPCRRFTLFLNGKQFRYYIPVFSATPYNDLQNNDLNYEFIPEARL